MSNFKGGFTISASGVQTYSGVGFQGNDIDFVVGHKNGSTTSVDNGCEGSVDETGYQECKSRSRDNSNHFKGIDSTSKCISVWEWNGSAFVEVLSAAWNSWTADGFKLNVTTPNSAYSVEARIRNT